MHAPHRRGLIALVSLVTVIGAIGIQAPAASAASPRVPHCVAPAGVDVPAGTDINALFGEQATIASNYYSCGSIPAGSPWVGIFGFYFAKSWLQVPPGYVPAAPTPREDFIKKFVGIRYVVDAGTPREFSVEFPNSPKLWIGDIAGYDPSIGDYSQYDWAQGMTLGVMRPLSVGVHTVQKSVIMSAVQCDGNFAVFELSCLPAGETTVGTSQFEWVAHTP
ncbi:hypothetical protein [Microbacterium capsulatum]|uniref:Secreted protein n=1 Tax=Microbacterium capsulatum TaxID=3041921 RepID=A0ABU0XL35_9MICO|nr:hypothetical protein [Microbacterium sp. ASV81]MDQ4215859.1 hypothetical protein [Microbacterium sp. ASV81]